MTRARPVHRLSLSKDDRLLVVAPHPDDELIAAGLILQKALAVGARVHVALLTLGDAFGYAGPTPVGKRVATRRTDNLGATRRQESLQALDHIGVRPENVTVLGYPDRGLGALWGEHWSRDNPYRSPFTLQDSSPYPGTLTPKAPYAGEALLVDLMALLRSLRPTLVVYPHPRDAHGDHAAASSFVTCALECLGGEAAWVHACRRLYYLVHRGSWPSPRGPSAQEALRPPPAFAELGERWVEVIGRADEIRRKYQAIAMYRSQIPPLGRFLTSFVRKNELFVVARPVVAPGSAGPRHDEPLIGAEASRWSPAPLILEPVRDSVTRQVEPGGDIASVDVKKGAAHIFLRIELAGRVAGDVEYRVILCDCPRTTRLVLRLKPPHRVMELHGTRGRLRRDVVARPCGNRLELAVPARLLGFPGKLFVGVETRSRGIGVDRTGFHLVHLPEWPEWPGQREPVEQPDGRGASQGVVYAVATPADLAACASVFAEAFRESISHIFKQAPSPRLIQEVFRLCYDAEPSALLVAVAGERVIGYVFAPVSLRRLWRAAVSRRHMVRWIGAWFRGRMRLGIAPLRILFLDKFNFVRSAVGGDLAVEARILSVAVAPEYRGRGIGSQLVRHALDRFVACGVDKVRLEVRPSNQAAVRVYENLGFRAMGTMHDSQGPWSIMLLDLNKP